MRLGSEEHKIFIAAALGAEDDRRVFRPYREAARESRVLASSSDWGNGFENEIQVRLIISISSQSKV
jgi:hypothetical protein